MNPLSYERISVGAPGHAGAAHVICQTVPGHVHLPLVERLPVHVLQDTLVTIARRKMKQDHVLGASVLEHSILTNPLLTQLPDLLLRLLPSLEQQRFI